MRYYPAFNNVGISHIMYTNSIALLENTQGYIKIGYNDKGYPTFWCSHKKCNSFWTTFPIPKDSAMDEKWKEAVKHYNSLHRL